MFQKGASIKENKKYFLQLQMLYYEQIPRLIANINVK